MSGRPLKPLGPDSFAAIPEPTIVLGLGRFGLSVLEQHGETWQRLFDATGDPRLANLRLLHVRGVDDHAMVWRDREVSTRALADAIGESDVPMRAIDFLFLRTLGLVRFHRGTYEVAIARDHGVSAKDDGRDGSERDDKTRRVRSFEWRELNPDPLRSIDALRSRISQEADLDLFLTPFLERVRAGQSPQVMADAILRASHYAEGRDPAPWPLERNDGKLPDPNGDEYEAVAQHDWAERVLDAGARAPREAIDNALKLHFGTGSRSEDSQVGHLGTPRAAAAREETRRPVQPGPLNADIAALEGDDGLVKELSRRLGEEHPDTLEAVHELAIALAKRAKERLQEGSPGVDLERSQACMNAFHAGHAPGSRFDPLGDGAEAFDPRSILEIPWEVQGWTTHQVRTDDLYDVVELPLWLHGFFDSMHDVERVQRNLEERLERPLRELGQQCLRGLLELFWELRLLNRPQMAEEQAADADRQETDKAVAQSMDLIAELLLRPLAARPRDTKASRFVEPTIEAFALPLGASETLIKQRSPGGDPRESLFGRLDARLAELGALAPGARKLTEHLFSEVEVARPGANEAYSLQVFEVRRVVREIVTALLDTGFLSLAGQRVVGRPPRLSIYIVGDLGEPFTRLFAREAIQLLHAELLRAFTAIFKEFRGGFDRNLAIVPILWFPNPSSTAPETAMASADLVRAVRHEEAVMIDSLLWLRRAINAIPNRDRFVPNVYICSRVNDGGVLSLRESVLQTHDFLSFLMRSDVGSDEWLRALSIGPSGRDCFGTFGCIEAEMPVERIREYLAGRLARTVLGEVLGGDPPVVAAVDRSAAVDEESDSGASQLDEKSKALQSVLAKSCDKLSSRAADRFEAGDIEPDPDAVLTLYSERAAVETAAVIVAGWPGLVAVNGMMDGLVGDLRRTALAGRERATVSIRDRGDRVMGRIRGGAPLADSINEMGALAAQERVALESQARDLAAAQRAALAQSRPDPEARIRDLFQTVRNAADGVPRARPMWLGIGIAALAGAVALGAVGHAICLAMELDRAPGFLEFLLGPLAPVVGAALGVGLTYAALSFYRKRSLAVLRAEVEKAPGEVRAVVTGQTGSVRSFLQTRVAFARELMKRGLASVREEIARIDHGLARRIRFAADLAARDLRRHAEMLGVQTSPVGKLSETLVEDIGGMLEPPSKMRVSLVSDDDVLGHYLDVVGQVEAQRSLVPEVVRAAGVPDAWRERVWFADRDQLLSVGRSKFEGLLHESSCDDPRFAATIQKRVEEVVRRHAAQLGLPGYVAGAEGLDDDGVVDRARSDLITGKGLARLLEPARISVHVHVREAQVRSHAVYLLTLVHGIALQLPLLHRRYMSFHERHLAEKLVKVTTGTDAPIHILTGREDEVAAVFKRFVDGLNMSPKAKS